MSKIIVSLLVVAFLAAWIIPSASHAQSTPFQLTSASLEDGSEFPLKYVACGGDNVSPELSWTGAPEGTKSFAVSMYDPDAPTGSGFWHWVVFNIPADVTSLAEGAGDPTKNLAPEGSIQGKNDGGANGYGGPCPPPGGKPHRYLITVFALSTADLGLDSSASGAMTGFMIHNNLLAQASMTVRFGQPADFQVTSPQLQEDGLFPVGQIGCDGGNLSPELTWTGAPEGTKSFAVSMYDQDAPTGSGFWHWTMFNIPADVTSLAEGAGDPTQSLAPEGSIQALNDGGGAGYFGPCPPAGDKPHHYLITVSALSTEDIGLDGTASGAMVGFFVHNNLLAEATLTAKYGR